MLRRQKRQVGKWIEDLACIAEGRGVQGHIAHPDGGKLLPVDLPHKFGLPRKDRHAAFIEAQRQEDAQRQALGREHPPIAGVRGKGEV